LAGKFLVATSEVRDSIVKEASLLADKVGNTSKHYLRVMEKVVSSTEAYLEKEAKR
jgi:protein disulfide-isomerase A6